MYDDFIIHLEGLKIGVHRFKFLLDDTFFKGLDFSLIKGGKVEFEVDLDKRERVMNLITKGEGVLELDCDRCGDLMHFPLEFEENTVVKFGEEEFVDAGIWEIPSKNKDLDISHFLYESVCLQLPAKITHDEAIAEESCDEESISRLNALQGGNNETKEMDPRWEALNKLK